MADPNLDPIHSLCLSAASGVPFYRQIVDQIAALVRSGGLPPGTLLPSAQSLAATLLVSLITTRRAYADLEALGLVVRRQGQGTFVADASTEAALSASRAAGRERLREALVAARQAGLTDAEIRAELEHLLAPDPPATPATPDRSQP